MTAYSNPRMSATIADWPSRSKRVTAKFHIQRDHSTVLKYARFFSSGTGIEYDDALQEARVGFRKAERADEIGQYDARLAAFHTYATHTVYRHMCSAVGRRRDVPTCELDDALPDDRTPAPDRRLLLTELIRELPDDARTVVELVLGELPDDIIDPVMQGVRGAAKKFRHYVRRAVGTRLRRGDRAEAAFSAIRSMLEELE